MIGARISVTLPWFAFEVCTGFYRVCQDVCHVLSRMCVLGFGVQGLGFRAEGRGEDTAWLLRTVADGQSLRCLKHFQLFGIKGIVMYLILATADFP